MHEPKPVHEEWVLCEQMSVLNESRFNLIDRWLLKQYRNDPVDGKGPIMYASTREKLCEGVWKCPRNFVALTFDATVSARVAVPSHRGPN